MKIKPIGLVIALFIVFLGAPVLADSGKIVFCRTLTDQFKPVETGDEFP